jgi:hypothetical protein
MGETNKLYYHKRTNNGKNHCPANDHKTTNRITKKQIPIPLLMNPKAYIFMGKWMYAEMSLHLP